MLAPIQPVEMMSISRMVANESRNLPWGSTLVVITAVPTDELLATLTHLKRAGRKVALIVIGGKESISNNGLTTYNVPADIMWEKMESLSLLAK